MADPRLFQGVPPSPVLDEDGSESDNSQPGPSIRRPDRIFMDDIKNNLLDCASDSMFACWNGWESASKFEDQDGQDYYMKLIVAIQAFQSKIRHIKRK